MDTDLNTDLMDTIIAESEYIVRAIDAGASIDDVPDSGVAGSIRELGDFCETWLEEVNLDDPRFVDASESVDRALICIMDEERRDR